MTLNELLKVLNDQKVSLSVADGQLVVRGPEKILDSVMLNRLRKDKQALIELIQTERYSDLSDDAPLIELTAEENSRIFLAVPGGAGNVQDIYPLAPLQEGILFHHLAQGDSDPYVLVTGLIFEKRERLEEYLEALRAVIGRHDILRTAVLWEGISEPVQVVWRKAELPVREIKLERTGEEAGRQLYRQVDPRRYRMDVREAPLIHAYVGEDREKGEWLLMLLRHHLTGDHSTLDVMQEEIEAHLMGEADRLGPAAPFRNLVAAARQGGRKEEQEAYFRKLLGDVEEPTAPFGLMDVHGDGSGVEMAQVIVEEGIARRVREQGRRLGVSAASVWHVAWGQVLARATNQQEVVFGTLMFGRMQGGEGADRAMGPFINTLPVRIGVGQESAEETVKKTYRQLVELIRHEHASLALAQRCSGVALPAPLFTSLLNYRYSGRVQKERPEERRRVWEGIRWMYGEERTNYPCVLSVDDLGEEGFWLTTQVAGIEAARVCEYMQRALGSLVEALETGSRRGVGQLEVLGDRERRKVVEEWNATEKEYGTEQCVQELFEEQVRRTPEAVAVVSGEETVSYEELNRRANRLAHNLRELGVGPEKRVGLCAERGVGMVEGLLGILKAGGAYVPLDPAYPGERLSTMLADSAPVAVVTTGETKELVGRVGGGVRVIDLAAVKGEESNPEGVGLRPTHAAYMIYTSGSTGTPKGVVVEHRGLCNLASAQMRGFDVKPGSHVLQFASLSFDASVWEVLMALSCGAALYCGDGELVGERLAKTVEREGMTHATLPPAVLGAMEEGKRIEAIETLIVAGEALGEGVARKWGEKRRLINAYGPTEATVCAAWHEWEGKKKGAPPIGKPIDNAQVYVLDGEGELLPVGVPGELYIGGAGVARGYWKRAGQTAERFVPDPFRGKGERLYRTGDLGRWREDGTLEYVGRNDFQVKVRGYRIELGEIEARLGECEGVKEAVVIAREAAGEDKRLVAYYTVEEGKDTPGAEVLRAHVLAKLPEYMTPAAYVRLESLPLTANGKLDRKALPAPEADSYVRRGYEEPVGETETAMVGIWAEVLKLERVGRHDNFFELGGHSLMAVQVMTRVRQRLGLEMTIRQLFDRPVLADLARTVESAGRVALPEIEAAERSGRLPLSFAQQRLWFLAQMDGVSEAYHIAFGVRLEGRLDVEALKGALNRIVARHEALRTTFPIVEGEPEQRIGKVEESRFDLEEEDLRGSGVEDKLKRRMGEEARRRFDLERGPLIRGRLMKVGDEEHVLVMTMHHIVSDGWSMGILLREMSQVYGAKVRGEADRLGELKVQYADYAVWQRKWMEGEGVGEQGEYWKRQLEGAPELLTVAADYGRPAEQQYGGGFVGLVVDEKVTEGLKELGRRAGTTLYMTVMAGWAGLLSRLSGQKDVVIGTPSANRSRLEIENLIGFFINTLAIRVDLEGSPTVKELLERVKRQVLGAQQNQDIPFEQVVEIAKPARSLSHSPVFQAMFGWQNTGEGRLELEGLTLKGLHSGGGVTSKFDLSLSLQEVGGRIVGGVAYAASLFERETIERYLGYFVRLLAGMAKGGDSNVEQLPMLGEEEKRKVVEEWNATEKEYETEQCVQELFEEQVKRTPEAVAVVSGEETVSYEELNRRANRLAHCLRELGVGPEKRVGLCVERGVGMVEGLLGILKAGGAYVPLDPGYPAERLSTMVSDSAPVAVVTTPETKDLVSGTGVVTIDLEKVSGEESNPEGVGLLATHAAYVIYTSGSTGTPKGVVVEHGSLRNTLKALGEALGLNGKDRMGWVSGQAFDISVWEMLGVLMAGGAVEVWKKEQLMESGKLREGVSRLTVLHAVPALMGQIVRSVKEGGGEGIREAVTGGDRVGGELVEEMKEVFGNGGVRVMYGPTETAIVAATRKWGQEKGKGGAIGKPVGNTRIYVLDEGMEPVAVGVTGELYIGGAGVGRGYWKRAGQTAERYVPDPFGGKGGRLYGTGDLGRWTEEGTLEYVGRNDLQVKVRGYRIELGEIEARLGECEGVREAVVVAREEESGDKRLVAYYTEEEGRREEEAELWPSIGEYERLFEKGGIPVRKKVETAGERLRGRLKERLPEYMVPAVYVKVDSWPLTGNGKVDRKRLPAPEQETEGYEAPEGETEEAIAAIWSEVLKRERVSRRGNFFELGGHSLMAVTVIERMRRKGLQVDVKTMFGSPTVAQIAAEVGTEWQGIEVPANGIREGRGEIRPEMLPLAKLTEEEIERIVDRVPGGAANVQDIYPLAPLQEGMLFHHLMGGEGDPYLLAVVFSFDSRERLDSYIRAMNGVIERHDILRTAVQWEGLSEPVQVVWRKAELVVEEVELEGEGGDKVRQLYERYSPRQWRMDLRRAPLARACIAEDRENGCWLMMLLRHHLTGDHNTLEMMQEEIEAHLLGKADRLRKPMPFRNLVAQVRLGVSREEHEAYFRKLLGDVEEPTAPFGLLDVRGDGRGKKQARMRVEASVGRRIREQSRRLGVSAASVCHVAWAQVLAQVSGKKDVVFGTVVFGRMQGGEGADRAMGLFINTLPVRIKVGRQGAEQSVKQAHAQLGELMRHEHAPLALAQRCSGVAAPAPLFTSLLNYRHIGEIVSKPSEQARQAREGMRLVQGEETTSYPIGMAVDDRGEGFSLMGAVVGVDPKRVCEYMHRALESLVEALEKEPGKEIRELAVIPEEERERVLEKWNRTEAEYPKGKSLVDLIEEQAGRRPEATAIVYKERRISYGELVERVNAVGSYLKERGAGAGERVGIGMERSEEMLVAVLGVMKSGAAYVPLDLNYPEQRLEQMAADAKPKLVVTRGSGSERLRLAGEVKRIRLDEEEVEEEIQKRRGRRCEGGKAKEAAYVIYTSGSTGEPKGVEITHEGLVNLVVGQARHLGVKESSRILQFASLSVDVLVAEMGRGLITGAEVVVAGEEERSGEALMGLMKRQGITHASFSPSMLASVGEKEELAIETLTVGGEACTETLVREWGEGRRLINLYGQTETTAVATMSEALRGEGAPTVGRPMANMRVYVLDEETEPVAVEVTGELYIGGAGVARGYWKRAEQTAERFVPDPFRGKGERLYRTGDLGKWREDGTLEYVGRNDFQVKVRGYRIELGEIEGRLGECEGVKEAVVIAREDVAGDKRLVAYYTAEEGKDTLGAELLRAHVLAKLPEYMTPAAYVRLERLPLTANGKLDRKALPAPEADSYVRRGYEEPVGETETAMAGIWAEVLKLERVGRHDNFFELGGHSLMAVQVMTRVRQRLGLEMTIRQLFDRPVLADLARYVESAGRVALPEIEAAERSGRLPLSFAQQRLWFLAQMDGVSEAYHIGFGVRLEGRLDVEALKGALNRIVARHEALRTTFPIVEGEPEQRIGKVEESRFDLEEEDLRGSGVEDKLKRRMGEEARRRFDLERGPLIRGRLMRVGDEEHVLVMTMHHIVSDGWSMGILLREMSQVYGAKVRGEADRLGELKVQYADYAVWQRKWMEGEGVGEQGEYWKRQLEGAPELLTVAADYGRPAEQQYGGGFVGLVVDEKVTEGLKELGRRAGTTLYMTVMAGWAGLLSRLSGQKDVVIGTPSANRSRLEIENLIGFFINTLAIRVDLEGSPTVKELLERVKRQVLGAQQNQDIPFEQVVEIAKPARSLSHSPVFQSMFAWQNAGESEFELAALKVGRLRGIGSSTAKFDLGLSLQEKEGRILGAVEYATSLFKRETIERYIGYFRRLLEGMAEGSDHVVEQLPILGEEEKGKVVAEWNATEKEYGTAQYVQGLFEEQVKRTPEAVAVVSGEETVSYEELNRRANRLAHYLRERGVGPEKRVGLCVERGVGMVEGLLGILKSGGAYVPLDPAYPAERLSYMISDSKPLAVVTTGKTKELVGSIGAGVAVIDLAEVRGEGRERNPERTETGLRAENLAYVIYTSGSTGTPKGVMASHRGLCNYLKWACGMYGPAENAVMASSLSFDGTANSVYPPLLSGSRLEVIAEGEELEGIGRQLETRACSLLNMTPAVAEVVGQRMEKEGVRPSVKVMAVGGEKLSVTTIETWKRVQPEIRIVHDYGPTETVVACTAWEIPAGEKVGTMSIGKPVANTQVYVLDGSLEPVGVGVTGELYVGGEQVTRGYQNLREQTAERFVPNPFVGKGTRMYGTGDLGKWLEDGTLEYVGRNDFQVKIRGYRIELGEIEARLAECGGIKEAVVIAREEAAGDKTLVAYYTAEEGNQTLGAEVLRAHVLARLPEYMTPAAYVRLESLPLTANGKVDRKALPAPEAEAYAARGYEEPVGETETAIGQIWETLLKRGQVGRHDNFFELGGHSLLAVSVIERLRRTGLDVDVRSMFLNPTLAGLAASARPEHRAVKVPANGIPEGCQAIEPEMLPLVGLTAEEVERIVREVPGGAANVQDIYPLAPLQEGILFHHLVEEQGDPYLLAVQMAFESRERLDAYVKAINAVIARHDILRTAMQWEGLREPVQVVWRKAELRVEEVQLEASGGEGPRQLYERYSPRRQKIDLRQAPLMKVYVAEEKEKGRWLMLQLVHHLTGDHSTVEVMHEEIAAHLMGSVDRLRPPMPFRNLVAQARLGMSREEHEEYFRKLLGDVEEPTAPYGMLEVRGDGDGVKQGRMKVEDGVGRRIREAARKLRVSAASVCHVAWAQVLGRLTGRNDVVFGTLLFGRMQGGEGADRAMGLFINTLPVRIRVGQEGAEETVRQTHRQLAELMRHEHASLAWAQRCSAVEAPVPLFSTLLNYRHSKQLGKEVSEDRKQAWEGIQGLYAEERTNYPLVLAVDDMEETFHLKVQAQRPIGADRVVEYMQQSLKSLVEALEKRPKQAISEMEVLPEEEKNQLVREWNETAEEYESGQCVHELFEEQVRKTPDAIAVVGGEERLSYEELNRRANRLARRLRSVGIGPDARVGMRMERGLEMVVGLLAVLKAGGAYVPLEVEYPAERVRRILTDSEAKAVLTERKREGEVGKVEGVEVIGMGGEEEQQQGEETNLERKEMGLEAEHLAYVIYTSGSTGEPKGVMVRHRGLCNHMEWMKKRFPIERGEKVFQKTPFSFDASVWEFWGPLLGGGQLVMAEAGGHRDAEYLVRTLRKEAIEIVQVVPTLLGMLMEEEEFRKCVELRRIYCGGEALSGARVEKCQGLLEKVEVVNLYGPTEDTIDTTYWVCGREREGAEERIGRPIANTQVYVVNEQGEPAPVGAIGELYIGGDGLARGYLKRAEQTAERFVPNPFGRKGERVYRTGDLGKWREDGTLEYAGRNDYQVKVRGYRIELGEIEARLAGYEGVKEAVVVVREDVEGDKRLVGYYTVEEGNQTLGAEELRAHVLGSLPEYMAPAAYVRLERMPLTVSGKVDRKELPAPEAEAYAARGYEAPVGETETAIAKIWAEVLKLERVGRHDDFFELGGHSLLAMQVMTRLRSLLKVDVTVAMFFSYPVLAMLAEQVVLLRLRQMNSKDLEYALKIMRDSLTPHGA